MPKAGESTQDLLQKFREEIEELNKRFSREDQENTRRTLSMNAKTKYQAALQSSIIPDKTIEHHFEQLMENIDLARRSFRFRDADRARSDWIVEATHLMQREIRGAKDLKKSRSAQAWFEEYLQLMVRLRDKVGNDLGLARRLYSTCNNIFGLVYREIDVQPEKNASEILESNLRLIKRFFPTATEEQKSKNDSLARTMERNATQIFKDQTKAK
ncbi:MAG: hypothetical protein M5U26_26230 [Planctomycetota bacterium]|nr:hypothetical protein [Planctomycetota bacterium]